jgi:hypothetical protein
MNGPRATFVIKSGTKTVQVKTVPLLTPEQLAEKKRQQKRRASKAKTERKSHGKGRKAA